MPRPATRRGRALLLAMVVAVCGATGVLAASHVRDPVEQKVTQRFSGPVMPPQFRPAGFTLRDQDGRRVSLRDYAGRVFIVSFMHAGCKETCPIMTQQIRGALDRLGADVPVLAITVEPHHDTPALARQFVDRQHMTGRMRFLIGSPEEVRPIWKAWGIQPEERGLHHSAFVFLVDRKGYGRVGFPAAHLTPEALVHDLRVLGAAAA